jgi:AcrR family transcriptional regulator
VRTGFHRTTMQDIAAEAGMSPGNLYRYFDAKEAVVAGIAERDRAELARDFAVLAEAEDFLATFAAIGRKHFAEEPREKAILCLEIWAEATRNPTFAEVSTAFECDVVDRVTALLGQAQSRGAIAADTDPYAIAVVIATLANGLFVRRAIVPSFDAKREVRHVLDVMAAMLQGAVAFTSEPEPVS